MARKSRAKSEIKPNGVSLVAPRPSVRTTIAAPAGREARNAATRKLLDEVRRHYLPKTTVLLADQGDGQKYLGKKLEALREMKMVNGQAAAYVCENFTCKMPVTDARELRKILSQS